MIVSNISFCEVDKCATSIDEKVDLTDSGRMKSTFEKYQPSIIVHAGTNSAGAYSSDFIGSYRNDSESLTNILDYVSENPNVLLIFFSSSYVYSARPPSKSYSETELLNPKHKFGIAKYFFEKLIEESNTNHLIFRLTNVYGPGVHVNKTTIQDWIENGFRGNDITVWGPGKRRLQYVYIDDVIDLIFSCRVLDSGIYNIGGEEYSRVSDIADYISVILKIKVKKKLEKAEGETLPFLNTDKIKTKLPDFGFISVKKGISRYIDNEANSIE